MSPLVAILHAPMQQQYHHTQDFLNDDAFVAWVLFGHHKPQWQHYLREHPDKLLLLEEARRLLLDLRAAEGYEPPALDQKAIWNKIRYNLQLSGENQRLPRPTPLIPGAIAWVASVLLVLGTGWLVWQNQTNSRVTYKELTTAIQEKEVLLEKISGSNDSVRIELEDGSVVTLGKNSKLSYPQHFAENRRTVILTGEAFFDVAKDASRPFYIYSNELITKVLGTSFRIRAFEQDQEVVVQVKTGRVSVYKQKRITLTDPETDGLVLLPNQQAVFSRPDKLLSRRLVAHPVPLAPLPPNAPITRYDEVTASKILRDIQDKYGISILFNDDLLNHCILTTTLGDESMYDALDLICKTIGATYKEVDAQIVIESPGCPY